MSISRVIRSVFYSDFLNPLKRCKVYATEILNLIDCLNITANPAITPRINHIFNLVANHLVNLVTNPAVMPNRCLIIKMKNIH